MTQIDQLKYEEAVYMHREALNQLNRHRIDALICLNYGVSEEDLTRPQRNALENRIGEPELVIENSPLVEGLKISIQHATRNDHDEDTVQNLSDGGLCKDAYYTLAERDRVVIPASHLALNSEYTLTVLDCYNDKNETPWSTDLADGLTRLLKSYYANHDTSVSDPVVKKQMNEWSDGKKWIAFGEESYPFA